MSNHPGNNDFITPTTIATDDPDITTFRNAFSDVDFHLLEPVRPQVNYSFEVMPIDPYTLELRADKWWISENGRLENSTLTLNSYPHERDEAQYETMREQALMEREELIRLNSTKGLQAAMTHAHQIGVANNFLAQNDPQLFTEGPDDPLLTQISIAPGATDIDL